jgi:hypothetical protein
MADFKEALKEVRPSVIKRSKTFCNKRYWKSIWSFKRSI